MSKALPHDQLISESQSFSTLVAPAVLNAAVLLQACTSLDVDMISLDLAKRLPFKLKPGPLQAALKRGVFFEVQP